MKITKKELSNLIYQVNGAAIEIHKTLGPGLLESVYHKCIMHELKIRGIAFDSEMIVPVSYKGLKIDAELRCDLFVESILVVELKTVEEILPIHKAQVLTYMNLLKVPKGLLINFNTKNIIDGGQQTFVNELYYDIPD